VSPEGFSNGLEARLIIGVIVDTVIFHSPPGVPAHYIASILPKRDQAS